MPSELLTAASALAQAETLHRSVCNLPHLGIDCHASIRKNAATRIGDQIAALEFISHWQHVPHIVSWVEYSYHPTP